MINFEEDNYLKTIILFLFNKANYYKNNNNQHLYNNYISLAYKYITKLEKVSDVNERIEHNK